MDNSENKSPLLGSRKLYGEGGLPVVVLVLSGSQSPETLRGFQDILSEELRSSSNCMVVDMAKVSYLNSPDLSALYFSLKESRTTGGDLRLCNLTGSVKLAFETMHLNDLFEIFDNQQGAVASFVKNPPTKLDS